MDFPTAAVVVGKHSYCYNYGKGVVECVSLCVCGWDGRWGDDKYVNFSVLLFSNFLPVTNPNQKPEVKGAQIHSIEISLQEGREG